MNEQQIKSLENVLAYLACEKADYEQQGKPDNHIYCDVAVLEQLAAQHRLQADEKPATVKAAFPAQNILSRFAGLFSAFRR